MQLQQIHQTPSVKHVHCKVQHNRFSCPAKSNIFSHRGPDYHQSMNGIALGVTRVPLWRCTCGEGNCLELQWRTGCIFMSLQIQPTIYLDNVNCTQNLKTPLNWKPFLYFFIREQNRLLIMKKRRAFCQNKAMWSKPTFREREQKKSLHRKYSDITKSPI